MNRRAYRKAKNAVFLSLSLLATLAGLACLAAILWTVISPGLGRHVLALVYPDDASARQRGRIAQCVVRQRRDDLARHLDRLADRSIGGHVPGRVRAQLPLEHGHSLHQ